VRFLSSRFASSVSLASCCSLGKLIKRSNAFSFSLRLRSAFAHDVDYLLSTERKRIVVRSASNEPWREPGKKALVFTFCRLLGPFLTALPLSECEQKCGV
jgi:hypothetical protein